MSYFFQATLIVLAALLSIKFFKLKKTLFVYLTLTPFLVFYQGPISNLLFTLTLGLLISLFFFKPGKKIFFLLTISILAIFLKYQIKLEPHDLSTAIHFINQQRGEHLNTPSVFLSRLLHNKSQLLFTLNQSIWPRFSPQALFAQAPYPIFNDYYPLGWLFPWDFYPLLVFISSLSCKNKFKKSSVFLLILIILIGLIQDPNTRSIITLSLVYFLSVVVAHGYQIFLPKKLKLFFGLNFLFLLLHFFTSQSYIQPL